jgi:4-hydroxyphenylacetate 3-monooxygenase
MRLDEVVGGGVLLLASSVQELPDPRTRPDITRYARSTGVPSEERIKVFRLAWDIIGSEFAGRHQQYEMFYAGAPPILQRQRDDAAQKGRA